MANISLRPDKCLFGSKAVNFLGYNLSEDRIKQNIILVEAINNFDKPVCKKDVKRFLGTVGPYRNFIKGFAEISQPLRDLTKEDRSFN